MATTKAINVAMNRKGKCMCTFYKGHDKNKNKNLKISITKIKRILNRFEK